jgi:hypothetical protein
VAGAYVDDNENNPMDGAFYEIKTYGRVLAQAEIEETVRRNQSLIDYRSSINTALQFVVKPYLQFATMNSIRILCETSEPSTMTVEYAETQPLINRATTAEAKAISEVQLNRLKSYTTYYYRVTCSDSRGNVARSDIFSFQTLPVRMYPGRSASLATRSAPLK